MDFYPNHKSLLPHNILIESIYSIAMSSGSTLEKKRHSYAIFVDSMLLSMRFPQKLWKIVNECDTGAIQWNNKGRTILLDYKKFQEQYLNCKISMFKTKNITSFIRQLNLYGFRKVTSHNRDSLCNLQNPHIHEFLHDNFQSGRTDLLSRVSRKAGNSKIKSHGKHSKRELSKEQTAGKRKPGSRLIMCQLALKEALEKAARQYRRERCCWENEDPLADIANSNSQEAVSELFGFDFNSIPNAEASMEWINRNSSLLSPTFKVIEEKMQLSNKARGTDGWLNDTPLLPGSPTRNVHDNHIPTCKSHFSEIGDPHFGEEQEGKSSPSDVTRNRGSRIKLKIEEEKKDPVCQTFQRRNVSESTKKNNV